MDLVRPFLKWPGNKFRVLKHLLPLLPSGKRLVEPFGGTCSVSLNAKYDSFLIGEINFHLINLYNLVQNDANFLKYAKKYFQDKNNAKDYYEARNIFNTTANKRQLGALFIYLNRHGFNGLCRYNQKGIYNVPFGRYKYPKFPQQQIEIFQAKAKQFTFKHGGFEDLFDQLLPEDVVYCDPPYLPLNPSGFTLYSGVKFTNADHIKLADLAAKAAKQGVSVLISNHDTKEVRKLYAKATKFHTFKVKRTISNDVSKRVSVKELVAVFN